MYCRGAEYKQTATSIPLRFGFQYGVATEIHLLYTGPVELELRRKNKDIVY